jgi:hypothetical protein
MRGALVDLCWLLGVVTIFIAVMAVVFWYLIT